MTLRRALFWVHLAAGSAIGVVILFLACTGALMAFEDQIVSWAERGARVPYSSQSREALPVSTLMAAASAAQQNAIPVSVVLFSEQTRPAEIAFAPARVLLLDPYSGAVMRTDAGKLRGFFATVRDLHRWLALQGVWRERARVVKAAVCLVFLFQLLSGLLLWIPRQLRWRNFRSALWVRPKLRKRALEWNLHQVVGIWFAVPVLTIAATGVIMAYPWANALLFRAAGSAPPAANGGAGGEGGGGKSRGLLGAAAWSSLDPLVARAARQDPKWVSLSFRTPTEKDAAVVFALDDPGHQPQMRSRLTIDRKTGEILRWEPFASNSRGRQWRLNVRYLHTGERFGLLGQTIALLSCLAVIAMVWSGVALVVRRWFAWRSSKTRPAFAPVALEQG